MQGGGQVAGHTFLGSSWDTQERIWEWKLDQETVLSVSERTKGRPERPSSGHCRQNQARSADRLRA